MNDLNFEAVSPKEGPNCQLGSSYVIYLSIYIQYKNIYVICHIIDTFNHLFRLRNPKSMSKRLVDNVLLTLSNPKRKIYNGFPCGIFWHPQSLLGWKYPKHQRKKTYSGTQEPMIGSLGSSMLAGAQKTVCLESLLLCYHFQHMGACRIPLKSRWNSSRLDYNFL